MKKSGNSEREINRLVRKRSISVVRELWRLTCCRSNRTSTIEMASRAVCDCSVLDWFSSASFGAAFCPALRRSVSGSASFDDTYFSSLSP